MTIGSGLGLALMAVAIVVVLAAWLTAVFLAGRDPAGQERLRREYEASLRAASGEEELSGRVPGPRAAADRERAAAGGREEAPDREKEPAGAARRPPDRDEK